MVLDFLGKDFSHLKNKKLFLFDMDGTIYFGSKIFDGVLEFLEQIKKNGGHFVFVTNNSSKSVSDYILKLKDFGISTNENNFLTSAQATILHFNNFHKNERFYAQGTKSFIKELKDAGLSVTEEYDATASVIVVAYDNELTSKKMFTTCKMLTEVKDAKYYATNPDWVCPVDFGNVPDCGSMCFGYEKATGRKPVFIGKPEPAMINIAMQKYGFTKDQTIVFGDRLYTDIASGNRAGVDTALVLSGEATIKDYSESPVKSTFVFKSVKDMLKLYK